MSLGMIFSFTLEVQITKNYCKNTRKIHWGYIGKYKVLTKGQIRIFEKKNEPERTEKDGIKSRKRRYQAFQLAIFSQNNSVNFNSFQL